MTIEHVALLHLERELCGMPRGMDRFREYLRTLIGSSDDVELPPLVMMNPMAREHVAARLDQLISIDAEGIARDAVTEANERLPGDLLAFKIGLVVLDDVGGGWTNRYTSDAANRFYGPKALRRGWLSAALWASEEPSGESIRRVVLESVRRGLYVLTCGQATSLAEMLHQEATVARFAGRVSVAEPADVAAAWQILEPLMGNDHYPTTFAAMYGDVGAIELGYPPLGLPAGGLELAPHLPI